MSHDLTQYEVEGEQADGRLLLRRKPTAQPLALDKSDLEKLLAAADKILPMMERLEELMKRREAYDAHLSDLALGRRGAPPPHRV